MHWYPVQNLRQLGVVGKFVEFFGSGVASLSIADRATIANMCPEYGATVGFFPVDERTVEYLRQTGRDPEFLRVLEEYMRKTGLFVDYKDPGFSPNYTKVGGFERTGLVLIMSVFSIRKCVEASLHSS